MNRRDFIKKGIGGLGLGLIANSNINAGMISYEEIQRTELELLNKKTQAILTIDDGPSKLSESFVEKLNGKNAVFFIIGENARSAKGYDSICNYLINGFILGNHSYSEEHPDFTKLSAKETLNEILLTDIIINCAHMDCGIKRDYKLFRFPYGKISKNSLEILNELGYKTIGWNVDSQDWRYYSKKAFKSEKEIMSNCSKTRQGDIVLCHERAITVEKIIPYFKDNFELILPSV